MSEGSIEGSTMKNDLCVDCGGRGFTNAFPGYPGQRWSYDICAACKGRGRPATAWGRITIALLALAVLLFILYRACG